MVSLLPALIPAVLSLLLAIGMITTAIIAHRGKRFWGTWMMLIGGIGLIVGTIVAAASSYFLYQAVSSSSSFTSATPSLSLYSLMAGIATLIAAGSLVAYLVGMLGLAIRYGAVAKRIDDLEAINASLISANEQPSR